MKFLFRFYMILFFSFFAFSYYAYAFSNYKIDTRSASQICTDSGGTILRSTSYDYLKDYSGTTGASIYGIWFPHGSDYNNVLIQTDGQAYTSSEDNQKYTILKVNIDYRNGDGWGYHFRVFTDFVYCGNCSTTRDIYGQCKVPENCPDGAPPHSEKGCDRTCKEVGLYTTLIDHDNDWTTSPVEQCSTTSVCDNRAEACKQTCGGTQFVKKFNCTETDNGLFADDCQCNESTNDQQTDEAIDNAPIDENTPPEDSLLTNKLLKNLKDNSSKSNDSLSNIESLLFDIKNKPTESTTDIVNSVNGLSTNIDSVTSSVQTMNSNIGGKLDTSNTSLENIDLDLDQTNELLTESNEHLTEIEKSNQSISDKLSSLVTSLFDAEGITDAITGLDIEGKMSSYLSSSLSQFGNVLGISSSYGARPSNITIQLFNKTYTLINFALLDPYISTIRALFLSLAYIYGFLMFVRKN